MPVAAMPHLPKFLVESDVEAASLEWFEALGYTVAYGPEACSAMYCSS